MHSRPQFFPSRNAMTQSEAALAEGTDEKGEAGEKDEEGEEGETGEKKKQKIGGVENISPDEEEFQSVGIGVAGLQWFEEKFWYKQTTARSESPSDDPRFDKPDKMPNPIFGNPGQVVGITTLRRREKTSPRTPSPTDPKAKPTAQPTQTLAGSHNTQRRSSRINQQTPKIKEGIDAQYTNTGETVARVLKGEPSAMNFKSRATTTLSDGVAGDLNRSGHAARDEVADLLDGDGRDDTYDKAEDGIEDD